jgi:leucyl-tRNA synthetase
MNKYLPHQFEEKWSIEWDKEKIYEVKDDGREKMYVLPMFPYPSGSGLHTGHARIYTGCDLLARYFRMKGKDVLHPFGYDAFGLPAENAAIKEKKNPIDMVPENIINFRKQIKSLGLSYDFSREFSTTDPEYYRWTQWLFIQFYKKGLLYKKNTPVNFCPKCKTGLAEEEVLSSGCHERCGTLIERRDLPQWVFKITEYADRLLEDLNLLDWPEGILNMQKNWIGKSEGADIIFKIDQEDIKVFTTRPDTLFGVSALILAPEHSIVKRILDKNIKIDEKSYELIQDYVNKSRSKSDLQRTDLNKDKTGVNTSLYAINPVNQKKIPVWIGDYVLGWYGHGAVMSVPAHDDRDFEFANKFGLEILQVIRSKDLLEAPSTHLNKAFIDDGYVIPLDEIKSFLNDQSYFQEPVRSQDFRKKMIQTLEEKNLGQKKVQFKLRDWIFSRQRYWGEPIPMVNCEKCGWVPVKESELPIKLPYVKQYEPTDTGESPLSQIPEFVNTVCPICGGPGKRETDTMPNWAGSCWYFLRFVDPKNDKEPWDKKKVEKWLPVDWYLGGQEHAVLHLLYSRFWVKAMYDLGLVSFKEPFYRLRNVGMVLAEDNKKMSKSLGNTINPDSVIKEYSADVLRVYVMFMAPFSSEVAWSTKALQGSYKFLSRIWQIYNNSDKLTDVVNEEDEKVFLKLQKVIFKVNKDFTDVKFNTSIALMMEFLNEWEAGNKLSIENSKKFLQILAPIAPYITEEIWRSVFGEKNSIHTSLWPEINEKDIEETEYTIAIQVNGKLRGTITVSSDIISDQTKIKELAVENPNVAKYLVSDIKKVIYIKGKVISFII